MEQDKMEREFKRKFIEANSKERKNILEKLYKLMDQREVEKRRKQAFFNAVKDGNIKAVENILSDGIEINQQDAELGNTVLLYAVVDCNIKLIQILLANGANPQIKNKQGNDSTVAAKDIGNKEIIKLLSQNKK